MTAMIFYVDVDPLLLLLRISIWHKIYILSQLIYIHICEVVIFCGEHFFTCLRVEWNV